MIKDKISILGLGYVGLPLALLASKKGHDVIGIDLDKNKVSLINKKRDPLNDDYIKERIKKTRLTASTNPNSIKESGIVIVCVPTPVKNYMPDLSPLKGAVKSVAKYMSKGTLVIIESTINPGVCDEVVIPLIEEISGLKIKKDFQVSHCPERINPGDKKWNVENIPRVVGSTDKVGLKRSVEFYESIVDAEIMPMESVKEAEACKVVENSFRDVNIAFVNELAKSFTKLGINVKNVIDGAATKPFAFMPHYPSIGVGGHCIPVDPYYLIEYARGYGFEHEFLSLARSINNSMPEFTVEQLTDGLSKANIVLNNAKIALLGLSYKPNVGDDRESPSYDLIKILKDKGANVEVFDPFNPKNSTKKGIATAIDGVDAIIIAVNHKQFLEYDFSKAKAKVFIDGKNVFEKNTMEKLGFIYKGIGV